MPLPSLVRHALQAFSFSLECKPTDDRLHVWGLGTTGRLGFGKDVERLFEPTQLRLPNSLEGAEIVDAQLGGETLFVVVQEA